VGREKINRRFCLGTSWKMTKLEPKMEMRSGWNTSEPYSMIRICINGHGPGFISRGRQPEHLLFTK
jgi:hypothetical protein